MAEPTPTPTPAPGAPAQAGPSAATPPPETSPGAVKAALDALAQAKETNGPGGDPSPFMTPRFDAPGTEKAPEGIDLLADVNLNVRIELGRTRMLVEDVLRLGEGSVVELDKLAGDPVDVYVNDRPVARGEVLVLNDNFCVRINEIIQSVAPEA